MTVPCVRFVLSAIVLVSTLRIPLIGAVVVVIVGAVALASVNLYRRARDVRVRVDVLMEVCYVS